MGLAEQLMDDMQTAMKNGDVRRRDVIRYLRAQIRNAEIPPAPPDDTGVSDGDASEASAQAATAGAVALDDDGIIRVIQRQVKQRQDSIELFRKAGRHDLADEEAAQMEILQSYLPQQLSDTELEQLVAQVLTETGATSMRDMGRVMPLVLERSGGRADPRQLSTLVRARLASS